MTKKEFLAKYNNKKHYGWVCYSTYCNPPTIVSTVLAVGMTKEEAKDNAIKNHGKSITRDSNVCVSSARYQPVTEAAYRKLKTAKTLNQFCHIEYEGEYIWAYSEN